MVYIKLKDDFINYMRGRNSSQTTLRNYDYAITSFFEYTKIETDEDILKVKERDIIEFLTYLVSEKKMEASSRNTITVPIKQLYRYLYKIEKLDIDENILDIQYAQTEKKKGIYLTPADAYHMLNAIKDVRSQSMVRLLLKTGIRVSELINIKIKDMVKCEDDMGYEYYKILINGKGHKQRFVYADNSCYKVIERYKNKRRKRTLEKLGIDNEYLFVSNQGNQMDPGNIRRMIKTYGKRIGFKDADKLSPHKLRHTYATNMLQARNENGGLKHDIKTVSASLGHSNIQTTSIYAHTDEKRISEMQREGW